MKKIVLLILLSTAMIQTAKATHAAAGEIIYSLVPGENHQYKFTLKFFRDCAGTAAPLSQIMCYTNQCGATTQSVIMSLEVPIGAVLPNGHIQGAPVPSGCVGANNTCNGGTLPGFQEYWYSAVLTLPSQCNSWHFWVYNCCRNVSIGNIDNAAGTTFFVETTYDNTNNQNFNTSPVFSQQLLPYVCVNIPVTYNNAAFDQNGDSLTYEIIEPKNLTPPTCGNFSPIDVLSPTYNIINNPFPTNNTFNINPTTGITTFTPSVTGTYVLTIQVNEYRNGNLIGHITREVQFVVGNCTLTQPTFALDTTNITGGYLSNNQITTCVGDTLDMCYLIQSANATASLHVTDNTPPALPGAIVNNTGNGTNIVNGCFNWVPTPANTGLHSFIINTIDSGCVSQGQFANRKDTILIQVNNVNQLPTLSISANTNTAITGAPLTFTATTNATPGFSIKWYRNNILSYTSGDLFWNTTMQAGTNTVSAVIENLSSCFSPDSASSNTVTVLNVASGLKDISKPEIKIYPNPATSIFNIKGLRSGDLIKIYNTLGEMIYTQKVDNPDMPLSAQSIPAGCYRLNVIRNNQIGYTSFQKL